MERPANRRATGGWLVPLLLCAALTSGALFKVVPLLRPARAAPHALRPDQAAPELATLVRFGVFATLYNSDQDARFKLPCALGLLSLARQTYPHWLLVLVGDGLAPDQIARLHAALEAAGLPWDRVLFQNMDPALREKNLYSEEEVAGFDTGWKDVAGVNAANAALALAYGLRNVSHVARLDDDDAWEPHHLATLAEAYTAHPEASFAYTQARGYRDKGQLDPYKPFPAQHNYNSAFRDDPPDWEERPGYPLLLLPPVPCQVILSATSWRVGLGLRARQAGEQRAAKRSLPSCCQHSTCQGRVLPADADLWEQVHGRVAAGEVASVLVAKPTVWYTDRAEKPCLLDVVHGRTPGPDCADAVARFEYKQSKCAQL